MAQHADFTADQLHTPKCATNAGDPTSSITPDFVGQILHDTSNDFLYMATGATSADWVRVVAHPKPDDLRSYPNCAGIVDYNGTPSPEEHDTIFLWPGLCVGRYQPTGNQANGATGLAFGDETDGSKQTSYVRCDYFDSDSVSANTWDFFFVLPLNWQGWGTNGIRVKTRHAGTSGSGTGLQVGLEILDPTTLTSFSPVVQSTRTPTNGETSYTWLSVGSTALDAESIGNPGGAVFARLTYGAASGPGDAVQFHIGAIELDIL